MRYGDRQEHGGIERTRAEERHAREAPRRRRVSTVLAAVLGLLCASLAGGATAASAGDTASTGAKKHTVTWIAAQYTIPAATGSGHDGAGSIVNSLKNDKQPPCDDCDIVSITPDLTDTAGRSQNMHHDGPMLHHVVLYEQGAQDASCPGPVPAFGMKRIFASGDERTEIPQVPGYGMYIKPGTKFAVLSDLMNFAKTEKTVQIRLKITYTEGSTHKRLTPVWLDVTGCGFSYVDVPVGKSYQRGLWLSRVKGDIVGLGGHVHEHGKWVRAINVFKGKEICRSVATQEEYGDGMHGIVDMTICTGRPLARINHLDLIETESHYDAPHEVKGAMGIMLMYVHET